MRKYHLVDCVSYLKTVEAETLDKAAKLLGVKIQSWALTHNNSIGVKGFATTDKGFGIWWE